MEQLVVVNRDALRAVVEFLWEDERVHYIEKCPRRTWFMDVRSFSDDHVFHSFLLRKEFWAAGSRAGIAKKRRILIL